MLRLGRVPADRLPLFLKINHLGLLPSRYWNKKKLHHVEPPFPDHCCMQLVSITPKSALFFDLSLDSVLRLFIDAETAVQIAVRRVQLLRNAERQRGT